MRSIYEPTPSARFASDFLKSVIETAKTREFVGSTYFSKALDLSENLLGKLDKLISHLNISV